jgi:CheY-like chemotaxis protein
MLQYIGEGDSVWPRSGWRGVHRCGIAGGRLVAKILVADDNSNIQKMVGLALKEQGIEVVAVGNGEAAVRKISDIHPDLVLADVFMPVRNGYEVCEYVKTDPTLSHIPVILLVGAFDPLDEQEAQRVGADGVLKKPFVPPDPLISMVKSALARAGVAHGAAGAAKTPEPEPVRAADFLHPHVPSLPTLPSVPAQAVPHEEPIAALDSENLVDEVPGRPEPVRIDAGSQTVAFGSLLDTTPEKKEEELGYIPAVHPDLATGRDWRDPDVEEDAEEVEEEKPAPAWRHEETETYAGAGSDSPNKGWRSGGFEAIQSRKTGVDSWEPAEEKPELHEVSDRTQEVPPAAAVIPEARTEIPAAPFAADAWAAVIAAGREKKSAEETVTALEEVVSKTSHERSSPEAAASSSPEVTPSQPEQKSSGGSWFSSPSSPWDSEIQKANRLASAWDSGAVAATPEATNGAGKAAEPPIASETVQAAIEEAALSAAAVEAIREEAVHIAEDATQMAAQLTSGEASFYARQEAAQAAAQTQSMDDLVAKVLAKLSPDVLQAVTREILKPVVEAMVKEEMKSKKS